MARSSRSSRFADSRLLASALGPIAWVIALAVAMVPVLQPLFSRELTCGYDNIFHLYRAVQIDHLWDNGVLYSRWAPDMALGYGFPLYLFTSFFPPALTALLHRLGAAWPIALNATFGLGIVLGGLFTYLLGCDLFGDSSGGRRGLGCAAGLVAAVAYVYAPFQAYDVFNRGSLWESFAWAFPSLVLLAIQRYAVLGQRRYLTVGVAGLAAMVLSHHLFAFLFAPVFGLWVVAHAIQRRDLAILGRGVLIGALGLGVTAFFWFPALAERSLVQTERLLGTWVFDFRYNFLQLGHLMALPRRADPALWNDWPEKALGAVPLMVGLISLLGWRRATPARRLVIGLLVVLTFGTASLTLPVSRWVWDVVGPLRYVQFPWRYLGPAAFCLALLAGAAAQTLADATTKLTLGRRGWPAAALVAAVVLANLGWFYPRHCAAPSATNVAGMVAWERATDTLGTTAKGEYLPQWVHQMPAVAIGDAGVVGQPAQRLLEEDLPKGSRIIEAAYGVQSARLVLDAPGAFVGRYLAFYYPGWRVTVDGEPVTVAPEDDTGLLTFPVPAGRHTIVVRFGETALRIGADIASLVALVACIVLALIGPGQRRAGPVPGVGVAWIGALPVLGVAFVLVAVKALAVDRNDLLWRDSRLEDGNRLKGIGLAQQVDFGGRARLLGLEPLPDRFRADDSPSLTLYWQALDPGDAEWRVGLAFVGGDGARFNAALRTARWSREPGPLSEWPAGSYARMDYEIGVPVGLPPGTYGVELSLFDRGSGVPASVLDRQGNPVGPALALAEVEIGRPAEVPSLAELGVGENVALQPHDGVGLWAAGLDREVAAPGDLIAMTMVWEALADPVVDLRAVLTLKDGGGNALRHWDSDLVAPWWPTSAWAAGERWVGRATVRLPGGLETGSHALALSLGDRTLATMSFAVVAPDRRWELPDNLVPADVVLGGVVRLAGVTTIPSEVAGGSTLDLELAWEALAEMSTSYRVFVHLVSGGRMLAQSDGEPVAWGRPTTGWAVGEIVVDRRILEIPAGAMGQAELRVGLYDAAGLRLLTAAGQDVIVLGHIDVR